MIRVFGILKSRTLYEQYTKHNIIHILHLRYDKDQYVIDFVEGFDEKGLQIDGVSEYKRINAILDEQSQVRLISQREENADLPRQTLVVLGRLNNRLFEETYGKEGRNAIYFEYVKFTLKNSPHWSALKNDERLFL